jgi:hypothetical protein
MFAKIRSTYILFITAIAMSGFLLGLPSLALACDCGQDANGHCVACKAPVPSPFGGGANQGHPGVVPVLPFHGRVCHVDQPPRGSYQQSCQRVTWDCKRLSAVCRNRQGANVQTSLGGTESCIGDIANMNGILRCSTGMAPPGGSYKQSCRDIFVGSGLLHAECRQSNGTWSQSRALPFGQCRNGIDNINGTLTCR